MSHEGVDARLPVPPSTPPPPSAPFGVPVLPPAVAPTAASPVASQHPVASPVNVESWILTDPGLAAPPATPLAGVQVDPAQRCDHVPPGYESIESDPSSSELLPTRAARVAWVLGQIVSVPLVGVGLGAAVVAWIVTFLALPVWSAMAAVNLRRARPATRHAAPPAAAWLALSWFTPFGVVLGIVVVGGALGLVGGSSSRRVLDDFTMQDVSVLFAIGSVVAVLISLHVPYAVHRGAARWVGADPSAFTRWFWAPVLAAVGANFAVIALSRTAFDEADDITWLSVFALLVIAVMPAVTHLFTGHSALVGVEQATTTALVQRRTNGARPTGLTPAQVAALGGQPSSPG